MNKPTPPQLTTAQPVTFGAGGVGLLLMAVVLTSVSLSGCDNAADPEPEATPVIEAMPGVSEATLGVSDNSVLFGQSAALSGPTAYLGLGMKLGIEAVFHEANQQGGINGRSLQISSLDDTYEPERAIANSLELIEDHQVFALIGAVGTPTSRSVVPVAEERGVPYIAPFTGAGFLRDPALRAVLNLRASYDQEMEELVERLNDDLGVERISVMYQDDSFGRSGYESARSALERRDMKIVSTTTYPRNTVAVKSALLDILQGSPEAVIAVGAYAPVAKLVSLARRIHPEGGDSVIFMTLSFGGGNELIHELGAYGDGVIVSQVVPPVHDSSIPVVEGYLSALATYAPTAVPDPVSFEGYLSGRLAIAGLRDCGQDVNRECFLRGIRGATDIDGFQLSYGPEDNQGSDAVFLTVIRDDGQYHHIDSLKSVRK